MKIENNTDFANWNNSVNHAMQQCDLQDVFARSDLKTLKHLFLDQNKNEKRMSIFAINKCMGSDTLLEFIDAYSRNKAESYIVDYEDTGNKELDIKRDALTLERSEFEYKKEEHAATIKALQYQNKELSKDNDKMTAENSKYVQRIWNLESELETMRSELDKQYQFETHIKGLLQAA